jgi:hypothetical protein
MTGVSLNEFEAIYQRIKPLWAEQIEAKKSCKGLRYVN